MFFYIFIFLNILKIIATSDIIDNENATKYSAKFYDITNKLGNVFHVFDQENNTRLNELKEKLLKIEPYIIDKDAYAKLLMNATIDANLNSTSFYYALKEDEKYKFLFDKDPKSLYVKLKQKMTRDDILGTLTDYNMRNKFLKSARRTIGADIFGNTHDGALVDEVVDKMIALNGQDNHKFSAKDWDTGVWDPQNELLERAKHRRHDGRRIYQGMRTTIKHYGFMVSIHVMGRFWCGGAIYNTDLVITSAACLQLMHNNRFFRENPRNLKVRVGSNHSRLGGEMIDAVEVFFHPSYNPRTLRNNIALIRLRRHVKIDYHRVPKKIAISYAMGPISATSEVLLLGWGVTKISQKLSFEPIFLQRKILPVFPNGFCKEVYGDKFVKETMFCAGTFSTGEGACDHDAGGPAVMFGRLAGIISFGPAICGFPNAPTVFTLIGPYADWIETIDESMPEYHEKDVRTTTMTVDPVHKFFMTVSPKPMPTSTLNPDVDNRLIMTQTLPPYLAEMTATPRYIANNDGGGGGGGGEGPPPPGPLPAGNGSVPAMLRYQLQHNRF